MKQVYPLASFYPRAPLPGLMCVAALPGEFHPKPDDSQYDIR
ncbi:MAG: hypothetical protein OHK0022_52900 [Roseiflexaceae bacterium]